MMGRVQVQSDTGFGEIEGARFQPRSVPVQHGRHPAGEADGLALQAALAQEQQSHGQDDKVVARPDGVDQGAAATAVGGHAGQP